MDVVVPTFPDGLAAVTTADGSAGASEVGETRGGRRRSWLRFGVAAVAASLILGLVIQARYGYSAGTNDHLVLSLQGLAWADPGFLVDDWFLASSPQPHILFDLVTWAGAVTGQLDAVYVGWWVLGLLAGGVATATLAMRWASGAPVLTSMAVAVLIGLGPQVALGSTTPALPTALPHELAGFLAYLSAALLLTRRPRLAGAVLIATSAVHVQIGALATVVAVLAWVAVAVLERRWSLLAAVLVSTGIVVTVLRLRPVASSGDDFVQICQEVIPFHCDATSWPIGQMVSGFAVVVAALLTVVYLAGGPRASDLPGRRRRRAETGLWAATVLAPAVGLTLGVLANRYEVPIAGRLAQSTNIFRLSVLLVPFGAWGLVAGFHRLSRWGRIVWLAAALPVGAGWLVIAEGFPALPGARRWAVVAAVLVTIGVLLRPGPAPKNPPSGWHRVARGSAGAFAMAAVGVLIVAGITGGRLTARPFQTQFVPDPAAWALGRTVAAHVPAGAVVQAPPTLGSIRLTAGRSVVVDCKAVPYGGQAWTDYRARLDAIGGRGGCSNGGRPYGQVPAVELLAVAQRYDARYLVLSERDRRVPEVQALGWRVLVRASPESGNMWLLAAPGAPDAAASAP